MIEANSFGYGLTFTRKLGDTGRIGRNGFNGHSGASGNDISHYADGKPVFLNLSGAKGGDASSDGERGENASNCYMHVTPPEYDLIGADGGNGGAGGSGGDGGHGGNLALYYTDLSNVKKVAVHSFGGAGGRASRGGMGGRGCVCSKHHWEVVRCTKDQTGKEVCMRDRFSCTDGRDGQMGPSGLSGDPGQDGHLTLIKGTEPLLPNVLDVNARLMDFAGQPVELAENIFIEKLGAVQLLAPGSHINDIYSEFVRRDVHAVKIQWAAKRSLNEFASTPTSIHLRHGSVAVNLDPSIWTLNSKVQQGSNITVQIDEALKLSEVRSVAFVMSGKKEGTLLTIKGGASFPDLLKNSILLSLKKVQLFEDKRFFFAELTPAQMRIVGNDIQIPIDPLVPAKYKGSLAPGSKLRWQAVLTRTMGVQSTAIDSGDQKHKP